MDESFIQTTDSTLTIKDWTKINPELVAGFTTKHGGTSHFPYKSNNFGLHVGDEGHNVITNRQQLADQLGFSLENWVCADQVHEDQIVKVSSVLTGSGVDDYNDSIKGTDGFYTNQKDILLTLCYADCVPVYFFAPNYHMIGIAHAGWKGTVKNISGKMVQLWDMMEKIPPSEIYVTIGPSINQCCYIVDDHVINEVDKVLEAVSFTTSPYEQISDGQYRLDLKSVNYLLLLHAGIQEDHLLTSNFCTSCDNDLFFSHRADQGKTGRMISYIGFYNQYK
ncbi:peptidoglycan editing factor PgeF [Salipaludibacillus sp. HK11]|uniref:peptidoglycan editing factor PgeF n=1 Tax=Salipaludibacillus sp. HK11 TaxID=3394320 RepID=UPI0039FD51D6